MKAPRNGQMGMPKHTAEMMLGVEIDKEVDEIVLTFRNGELTNIEGKNF